VLIHDQETGELHLVLDAGWNARGRDRDPAARLRRRQHGAV